MNVPDGSQPKMNPPPKHELRLIFQGSVPIEDTYDGEQIYKQLKDIVRHYHPDSMLSGQILKHLEPCCKEVKQ